MKRFELIAAQALGMAYILTEKDSSEYSQLREAAEKAIPKVIQPIIDTDSKRA